MRVEVTGLTKRFGDATAVDNVTFSIEPGQVTGFVGPNGSGKSTTIRMMLGLLPADGGTVRFDGHAYGHLADPRTRVGAVVDRIGAHPRHSARAHLTMIATASGISCDRVLSLIHI